jgi:poly(ADP-ribose) polymerase-like protein
VIEPAATGRAKCRGCGQAIAAGVLRFGEGVPNPFGDGETSHWYHLDCGAYKRPASFLQVVETASGVEDVERLKADAQQGIEHERLPRINGAERDPSGRAQCRQCKTNIAKGAWRITLVFWEEGRFNAAGFVHPGCAQAYFEAADVMPRVKRFAPGLGDADLQEIGSEVRPPAAG